MAVKLPADLRTRVTKIWFYDSATHAPREHSTNGPYPVPRATLRWCPQPDPAVTQGSKNWRVMLHDHARPGGGHFYAEHEGKNGKTLHYTFQQAMSRAATLNGDGHVTCVTLPTPLPAKDLLEPELRNLKKLKKAELVAIAEAMILDFQTLNGIYNSRADENGWCGEYEGRQARYNRQFRVFRLCGRDSLRGGLTPGL